MKKSILLLALFGAFLTSCGDAEGTTEKEETKEETPKHDKSTPEYQLAEILCDCFETFNPDDSMGQMEAVGCLMEKMEGKNLEDTDEEKTKAILADICPETAAKFDQWQKNMKEN